MFRDTGSVVRLSAFYKHHLKQGVSDSRAVVDHLLGFFEFVKVADVILFNA